MKRIFTAVALAGAASMLAVVPMLSHAAGPSCASATAKPTPPAGSQTQSLAPADPSGKAWLYHDAGNTKAQAGSAGSHGWMTADANSTTKSASVKGYSKDTGLNGDVEASQTGGVYECAAVNPPAGVPSPPVSVPPSGVPAPKAGTCTSTTNPKAPAGSTVQSFAPGDPSGSGWVYHNAANTAAQVGAAGSHGYIVGSGDSNAKSASVKGYSKDSGVNGDLEANSTKPSACIGANGQMVKVG
jgi:hypothetical protein